MSVVHLTCSYAFNEATTSYFLARVGGSLESSENEPKVEGIGGRATTFIATEMVAMQISSIPVQVHRLTVMAWPHSLSVLL